ncbi:MAG: proton-conducting transporter transmembrane domain-containing protein, partial [Deferrisomatales bacterium]
MLVAAVALPFAAALLAWALPGDRSRLGLLLGASAAHLALVAGFWRVRPPALGGEALALDDLGLLFLTVTSVVFALVSLYTPAYLERKGRGSTRVYVSCSLALLGAMGMVCSTRHFGLLWVAIEASTLAGAPLIAHRLTPAKLEATWKYLLLCSVGVALALLGTFFLGLSAAGLPGGGVPDLTVSALQAAAPGLSVPWLKGSFVLLLVGYGTKMGLAPLHAWLPDAYGEAPSPTSALFSGALSNCAFLGVLRALPVLEGAGLGGFGRGLLLLLGFASLVVAAGFILGQADLKRMLAYSSVENYGIMAVGVGLGGVGTYGALLHAVNHSVAKVLLFLLAGNVLVLHGTRTIAALRGVAKRTPWTGALFAAGFLAIAGSPPFGPFLSEFTILRAALDGRGGGLAVLYLLLLGASFVGLTTGTLAVLQGEPAGPAPP